MIHRFFLSSHHAPPVSKGLCPHTHNSVGRENRARAVLAEGSWTRENCLEDLCEACGLLYWPCLFEDLGGSLVFFTHLHIFHDSWHHGWDESFVSKRFAQKKRSYLCFFTICVCFWEFIVCHSRTPRTGSSQKKVMNIQRRTRRSNSKNTRDGRVCRCSLACSPRFSWVIMGHPLSSWWCMPYILVGPWWNRSILM